MTLKRFDLLLDNKLSLIRLYIFIFVAVVFFCFACFLFKSKDDQHE